MLCIDCVNFKEVRSDIGTCTAEPPVLQSGKNKTDVDSFFQPMTYADWTCGKFSKKTPKAVEKPKAPKAKAGKK